MQNYTENMVAATDGGGGGWGACPQFLHFNFPTKRAKRGPEISVSNRDITFYRRSEIIRTINYTIFTAYATIFVQFIAAFNFSNYIRERLLHVKVQYLPLDLLKSFFCGSSEKKPQRIRVLKNFSKTRETSIISGPELNVIASILELVKIFCEVIVASKCGPLARIEKQAIS